MAFVPPPGYQPIYNPTLPYAGPISGNLRVGMSIYVHGKIPHHISRFQVNLQCGNYSGCDIALHINPRFDLWDKVVFNTFQGGCWMSEEKAHMPFRKGDEFEMVIIVNQEGYQVNVNGQNFYFFQHRLPFEEVDTLEIGGDVVIQTINIIGGGWSGGGQPGYQSQTMNIPSFPGQPAYQGQPGYQGGMPGYQGGNLPGGMPGYQGGNLPIMGGPAIYSPVVPYSNMIPGGLSPKRTIIIRGMVPPGANRFHINFKVSYSGDIVFHLNPRFTEFIVVRNSFLGGCWGREEKELEFNPFQPGQYFDMSIRSGNQRFKVYVNGQHLCSFNHRFQEFQQVDTLEVEGDVQLSYVQF
ncbi:galectin-4-like isoform X3 [Polypterus senegalus]|uniref:galectin-4-like isoform X3 n=1 Tax=Polypterus senegalus TaxID=55291 RepID=UPI00196292E3|nr:galectin-4-like isoform X3 [Polypterus senegalus]XP_039624133.1 galectin-4-like isoform X3 [Polypterus senegalus]XP_039624134.1 galectin-4-like isoform X3 [Polypterus senegalus]